MIPARFQGPALFRALNQGGRAATRAGLPLVRLDVDAFVDSARRRTGLEDFGDGPGNVEQVQRAVALCEELGRPVATNAQAREILGMPAR